MIELPFRNRRDAGQQLGGHLAELHFDLGKKAIVLGLARGGVSVAAEVAALLHLPLDVVVVRKLGFPGQKELAMGAVAGGRIQVLDNGLIEEHRIQSREVEKIAAKAMEEASWREHDYRAERATPDLHDSTVILVDDGLATGSSMLAAAHYVNSFKPKKVIAAAPVGTEEACSRLKKLSDHCVCLATPKGFHAVGQCYLDFTQVTDDEVRQILEQNDRRSWLEQQGPLTGAPP
jgi:putative phosphoribosyl transferase